VFVQAVEQISGGTLFASPLGSRWGRGSGSDQFPFSKHTEKRGFPSGDFQGMHPTPSFPSRLFGGGFHVQEQVFELGCPERVLFFCQKDQITQEMHQAESMLAAVQEVRPPAIMNGDSVELRQNPDRLQRFLPTARIVRKGLGASGMHPVAFAQDIQPRFILVDDVCCDQGVFDLLLDAHQSGRTALDQGTDGSFAHRHSQQISHDLRGACQGQQLLLNQIHRHRANRRPILHRRTHRLRKTCRGDMVADRTLFVFRTIFLHDRARRWDIMNLSAFHVADGDVVQIVVTGFTLLHRLQDNLIGGRRPVQACSRVSRLPTRFLVTFLAQAFCLARKTVRRWGQAAIVAVFSLSLLQRCDVVGQAPDLFLHLLHQAMLVFQRGFQVLDAFITLRQLFTQIPVLFLQMLIVFFKLHTRTLLDFSTFDKSLLT